MTTSIILVHGAWADGSSWAKVIPLLKAAGLEPTAVQLPLTSLADDAAVVKRALALVDGPVLMAGHSYGGCVITEAGDDQKVGGLVYVAAFAPDVDESSATLGSLVAPSPMGTQIRPDAAGFLKLTREGVADDFAQDLTDVERGNLFSAQAPTHINSLGGKVTVAAWRGRPSWFVHASNDRTIPPELQDLMAKKIGAQVISVASSHVPMLSHADVVAEVLIKAAKTLQQ